MTQKVLINENDHFKQFQEAERLLDAGEDNGAGMLYRKLIEVKGIESVALFRLGEIENRMGRALLSYNCHINAFIIDYRLASRITAESHPFHDYRYKKNDMRKTDRCPLCEGEGKPHWAYNMVTNADFNEGFDPVRLWLYCGKCNHLFASARPDDLTSVLSGSDNKQYQSPNPGLIPMLGTVVSTLYRRAPGKRFLDVGIGAGEMIAVAGEFGFDASGLEIRPAHAGRVAERLGVRVICADFSSFETSEKYDVICMGDVLEHIIDPVKAIERAARSLNAGGLLWISTPNFESAFSIMMKDKDPMKRVCEHLNYFSFASLKNILERCGFEVTDYGVSAHYNGSMEVTSIKKSGM
ncbi:MAG: class I SAM-dependent methyltransferase [Candidatus Krumholzibacteriota bacterium]|nr:class I SAM-dependent methyltransferase [Candidatus Krumholzibacteriota bacterium]